MAANLLMKFSLPSHSANKMWLIRLGQTVREVIEMIAKLEDSDIHEPSLEGCALAPAEIFDNYFQSLRPADLPSRSAARTPCCPASVFFECSPAF
jgi:hypothetical protein